MGRTSKSASRRLLISAVFIVGAAAFGALPSIQTAQAESKPSEIRAASWLVGGNLALATMSYFRSIGSYEGILDRTKTYATYIDVDIKPFPPKPANPTDGILSMLDYFNKGDGAAIGTFIENKHGKDASLLYLTAIRTTQLPLFYDLDPALSDKLAEFILVNMTKLKVPEQIWKPLVEAVVKRGGFEKVRDTAQQMNDNMTQYLLKS